MSRLHPELPMWGQRMGLELPEPEEGVRWGNGPGLVGLHIKGILAAELFVISRNQLNLSEAASP